MGSAPAHALVFGASGIAGWGVVEQLLDNFPAKGTFSNVTAVVNRPMRIVDSFWPTPDSPALDLVTNIDLTQGTVETLAAILKDKVENIAAVTHVYYFGMLPLAFEI
jgi:nucleoside-diphosphate-sugar epimerase